MLNEFKLFINKGPLPDAAFNHNCPASSKNFLFVCLSVCFWDWLAFTQGTGEMTFHGKIQFENGGAPLERDNLAFCKVMTNLVVGRGKG